jgi:predicted nucleic acid-binding Zn ribbon protein
MCAQTKGEEMENQMGEYQCTNCHESVVLAVGDDSPFNCKNCGGEECEMNFNLAGKDE